MKMVGGKRIVQSTGETVLDAARKVRDGRLAGVVKVQALENIKIRLECEEEKAARVEADRTAVQLADGWKRFLKHPVEALPTIGLPRESEKPVTGVLDALEGLSSDDLRAIVAKANSLIA